jgi:hypothetical protein
MTGRHCLARSFGDKDVSDRSAIVNNSDNNEMPQQENYTSRS